METKFSFDLVQFGFIAGLIVTLARIWIIARKRDSDLKDAAVKEAEWRLKVEHQVELLKTQGCKDTVQLESFLNDFRKEVKEDHEKTEHRIEQMEERFDKRLDKIEETGRTEREAIKKAGEEGRRDIYRLIETLRTK